MVNRLAEYAVHYKHDLKSAYNQILILIPDRKYTALEVNCKLCQYKRENMGVHLLDTRRQSICTQN